MTNKTESMNDSKTESPLDGLIQEELKRSFEKGMKKGEASGYEKAQREMKTTIYLFRKMTKNLLDKTASLKAEMETEFTDFCLKVCQKLLLNELQNPDILIKVIFKILSQRMEKLSEPVVVYLSPSDLKKLKEHLKKYDFHPTSTVKWEADTALPESSFRIDLSDSVVFYDIPTEIDNLAGHLEL